MTLCLIPEIRTGLGEDTFWTWAERELDGMFRLPESAEDVSLVYSTMDPPKIGKTIACCWELYPEMRARLRSSQWDRKIAKIMNCAMACDEAVVASSLMHVYYPRDTHCIPIGVDMDLFQPRDKAEMRRKHGIPSAEVGFWCGTRHPMKGMDRLQAFKAENPDVYMIEVMKGQYPQHVLAELMSCADFVLCCGRLRPYFLVEWEAMACDVPPRIWPPIEKDFLPKGSPRAELQKRGWSRHSVKERWRQLIGVV